MRKRTKNLYMLALSAIMAAVIGVLGPVSIAVGVIPISLGTLGIYLAVDLLGMRYGTLSCAVYILLGLVGLPVFTGFTGGAAKILGPTGGYILGYVPMTLLIGFLIGRFPGKVWMRGLAMLLGTLLLYGFGTVWLAVQLHYTFYQALWAGVIPFIPGDLFKIAAVCLIGPVLKKALAKSGLYPADK